MLTHWEHSKLLEIANTLHEIANIKHEFAILRELITQQNHFICNGLDDIAKAIREVNNGN